MPQNAAKSAEGRVGGADESYALAERLFGWTAPIQYTWIYPRHPGDEALRTLVDRLASGRLNRRVIPTRLPIARDRWVKIDDVPPLYVEPEPIGDDAVGDWVDSRLRACDLDPSGGRGWHVDCASTTSGRLVVALLVSHMIADGQAVYRALAAAHAGIADSSLPAESDLAGPVARLGDDVVDAAEQLGSAAKALTVIVPSLWRESRRAKKPTAVSSSAPVADRRAPDTTDPGTTLAIIDVDSGDWETMARKHGGTGNGLFTALLGGILRRSGYPMKSDGTRICIAVSTRADGDERANASGGVWIRVPGDIGPEAGLADIRAASKKAFADYAVADNAVTDHLQPVARLLPDRLLGSMMKSIAGPDTTVSNLGKAPQDALELGGVTAESFAIRAIMQGRGASDRRKQGPAIAAWAVEYGSKVTITFFGIDPDYFGDRSELRDMIDAEFTRWSLPYAFW